MALKDTIRYCEDIGMFALDFPTFTCRFRTAFCNANCYNVKLYRLYKGMVGRDKANYQSWLDSTVSEWIRVLSAKRKPVNRFRFATRGETLLSSADIDRVIAIAQSLPNTLFWIPTRAWRDAEMRAEIVTRLFPIENIRLCASLDPSNTQDEETGLIAEGWSTLYYGDDTATDGRMLCPKTHGHVTGACATCANGCFSKSQTHVHLKKH